MLFMTIYVNEGIFFYPEENLRKSRLKIKCFENDGLILNI